MNRTFHLFHLFHYNFSLPVQVLRRPSAAAESPSALDLALSASQRNAANEASYSELVVYTTATEQIRPPQADTANGMQLNNKCVNHATMANNTQPITTRRVK
jgi:hypothetical protein